MTLKEINDANIVILKNELVTIVINKNKRKIFQIKSNLIHTPNIDVTDECLRVADRHVYGTPYKGGTVAIKILNNQTDMKCKSYLKSFQVKLI